MKKEYKFNEEDNSYIIKENDNILFTINKDSLEFNSMNFYSAFFESVTVMEKIDITLENMINTENKLGVGVYNTVKDMFAKICGELNKNVKAKNTTKASKKAE